ncbi:class I SAM-dependent methyltransferase [Janthinobacterium sp. 1_2014MBL_MicDiv]|uniref:class I SAM-dependent methyltransferase n=1 Tax=Janthinobacterium sp. 1_2014MBL_MicDiv TaxID=1644131 RepID=UPI0008F486CC|nr:class I SAM-dependent methyltransferase [Janthinobacterium sp. 1_2014MBL_MicDiv]APA67515.1 methyltransferase [Janthinobacterium sp. 1_2014MBL_MicDiv]
MNASTTPDDPRGAYFDQLYRHDADPWLVRQRWYEERKRALLLASLPQQRYRHAYEPGCGNGELTVDLARRCERVLAADLSAEALQLAQRRLEQAGHAGNVSFARHRLPQDWPRILPGGDKFDLIVISEIAYYLSPEELARVVEHSVAGLAPGGSIVACHWRAPFAQRIQSTVRVHAAFQDAPGLHRLLRHEETDFLLGVWSNDARSVAQREGFA